MYLNLDYSYVNEALENAKDVDVEKLKDYAIAMDSKILINKFGFLLESFGIMVDGLLKYRSLRYAVLSKGQKINSKWRVKYD